MQFQATLFSYLWILLVTVCSCDHNIKTTASKSNASVILERRASVIEGNFTIGAIFSIHDSAKNLNLVNPLKCESIQENYGIQRVEAALYAIDRINRDEKLLPSITLGIDIRDGCSSSLLYAEQAIKFIEESADDVKYCSGTCKNNSNNTKPLIAIVGIGYTELNTSQMLHIPLIEYSSVSHTDIIRYGYIHRVLPQLRIIGDILFHYGWSYISLVYSDDKAALNTASMFPHILKSYGVCVVKLHQLSRYDALYTLNIVRQLSSDENVKVVVCLCDAQTGKLLLQAISFTHLTNRFILIIRWKPIMETMQNEMDGSIIINTYADEFDPYYITRTPFNNGRNPWFTEFWQYKFNCTFDTKLHSSSNICSGTEDLRRNYQQDPEIPDVIKTIYKLAHSLHKMIPDVCGNSFSPCSRLYPFNGTMFKEYIVNEDYSFHLEYNQVAQYHILNYQKLTNGMYNLVQIGNWNMVKKLKIWGEAKFHFGRTSVSSVCSLPCNPGHRKNIETQRAHKECCWSCIPCSNNEIVYNGTVCEPCKKGYWPNANKTTCEEITPTHVQWNDIQSIVSLTLSCVGIKLTIITAVIFVRYSDTPVVKASTKELCYFMLFGMCLAHCVSVAFVSIPSTFSCVVTRILPGFSFSIVYGSLLVKTNRIARILAISKKKFPNMKPRFMSTTAQISICIAIITVELIICIILLISEPASPQLYYPTVEQVVLKCNTSVRSLVLPLLFDGVLVILCTLFAVKTRNIPSNFNETKFIGFSMYTTCITWVAFGLIYYESDLEVVTQCVSISVNALVILVFLFFPKLYIILFHPEKNTRENFFTSKGIRCFIGNTSFSRPNNIQNIRYVVNQS